MNADSEQLRISDAQIKEISGVAIQDSFLSEYYRVWAKLKQREPEYSQHHPILLQFIGLELALVFVAIVFTFPIAFLIAKNLWISSSLEPQYSDLTILVAGLGGLLFFLINLYLYAKSKPLLNLLNLLNELEKYEGIVDIFYRMDKLIAENYIEEDRANRDRMVHALQIAKHGFLHALKSERLVRDYRQVHLPDELFEKLNHNLSELIDFDVQGQDSHYARLINETLEIGINVHRELRKLQQINN